VPPQLPRAFARGGLLGVIPWPVVVAAIVVGGLWVVLAHTRFGLRTYALGANREALRRAGVNVNRHTIALYVLMGILSAIVGLMDVARFSTASLSAHTLDNLNAIAAVVIGGTSLFGGRGRMSGTIIGAFIPAVLRNGFILMAVQPFWQNVVVGAFLVLAVYVDQLRRGGLFVTARASQN
jgi:ribose transport system permease protein